MTIFLRTLEIFFELMEILIIIRVFMSIFRISYDNALGRIVYEITEPIITPAKILLNKLGLDRGMFDFSPWIAIFLLRIVYSLIMRVM
ncbi:YggT family protein [Tissierella sp. Yu-01]|jgi:YggT family protein|uniref:YggT family protein n=1 Tax=Tissierella sp. Yu-01 TaxID=3035694 RepID=UPI00240E26CC|nr:YggT family protein [Tissierella sp. Yu-01]WFA09830.1 YggT family protein [Tissierella sp. Yu-01]